MSQEQVVPKCKLLVDDIDLEMCTDTQMVIAKQVKLEARDQNKLEKDFEKSWDEKSQHFVERCDRHDLDEAWEMLSDAYKDAFPKQQSVNH